MVDLSSLSPAERARQLGNPDGEVGVELSRRLNKVNNGITEHVYDKLALASGMRILEIGFGNGHSLSSLLGRASDLTYHGIDISQTMIDEAIRANSSLVDQGQATFRLATAEDIPADIENLDRAFAINVIYFWADPVTPLHQIRRVLKPEGVSLIAAISPDTMASSDFATPELGFHLRSKSTLAELHREAGFGRVRVENYNETVSKPDGTPWEREYYLVFAQP